MSGPFYPGDEFYMIVNGDVWTVDPRVWLWNYECLDPRTVDRCFHTREAADAECQSRNRGLAKYYTRKEMEDKP